MLGWLTACLLHLFDTTALHVAQALYHATNCCTGLEQDAPPEDTTVDAIASTFLDVDDLRMPISIVHTRSASRAQFDYTWHDKG